MKIIHTADIHLDSPLVGVADAKLRRTELVLALSRLSEFANNNAVDAIIVAGDLFDDRFAKQTTVQSVAEIISASRAQWFVLRGNHGDATPYNLLHQLCPAVKFFGEDWTTYSLGEVNIIGRELGVDDAAHWKSFSCPSSDFNILVLHGDIDDNAYGMIDKKVIASSSVNYVALGHRHAFSQHQFGRVPACYCGVLEARGFDESAPTGFVLLDTEKRIRKFQPQALRRVESLTLDVTPVATDFALQNLIADSVATLSPRNLLNVEFVGTLQQGVRLLPVAQNTLENRFFALRLKDKTVPAYNLAQLAEEVSLRGEFVKLALQLDDPEERNRVLTLGLAALNGEV